VEIHPAHAGPAARSPDVPGIRQVRYRGELNEEQAGQHERRHSEIRVTTVHKRFATLGMVSLWKSCRAAPSGIKANESWAR